MAIRFVDVEPEKGAEPAPAPSTIAPEPTLLPEPEREAALPVSPEAPLLHAKPEPKPRGRKKPLAARAQKPKAAETAPLFDGLLPELQAHAKPVPKPRGRKTGFG